MRYEPARPYGIGVLHISSVGNEGWVLSIYCVWIELLPCGEHVCWHLVMGVEGIRGMSATTSHCGLIRPLWPLLLVHLPQS